MLVVKTKNALMQEAAAKGINISIQAKNISINGRKVGCSGFARNVDTGSVVYFNTEKSTYDPLADKSLYRYALDEKDFGSNGLRNGFNNFCEDAELAKNIVRLLVEGKGEVR